MLTRKDHKSSEPNSRTSLSVLSWATYDWANSAYAAVVGTFVFSTYFTQGIAPNPVDGTAMWGYAISISGLLIGLISPILGAISDQTGNKKSWILFFTCCLIVFSSLLWFAKPDPTYAMWALILIALCNFSFEMGIIFYNAMLPDVSGPDRIGRVSGWSWGFGYAGGLVCLGLTFVGFVNAETPWFGLDKEQAEHLRITGPIVAIWLLIFSLPLFLFTPESRPKSISFWESAKLGLVTFIKTLKRVRHYMNIVRFLIAHMIYRDGLTTLFTFGGIYAAGTFGMEFSELILFGIGMSVTAGIGATAFGWIDDWIGPRRTIIISLVSMTILSVIIVCIESKTLFWGIAMILGVFIGPTQAASRSMMAHLSPIELRTELFGFFALSGKATNFVGPAILAWVTSIAGSQRAGMATIIVFFLIGLLLFFRVTERRN